MLSYVRVRVSRRDIDFSRKAFCHLRKWKRLMGTKVYVVGVYLGTVYPPPWMYERDVPKSGSCVRHLCTSFIEHCSVWFHYAGIAPLPIQCLPGNSSLMLPSSQARCVPTKKGFLAIRINWIELRILNNDEALPYFWNLWSCLNGDGAHLNVFQLLATSFSTPTPAPSPPQPSISPTDSPSAKAKRFIICWNCGCWSGKTTSDKEWLNWKWMDTAFIVRMN